jgi:hypothetical protein
MDWIGRSGSSEYAAKRSVGAHVAKLLARLSDPDRLAGMPGDAADGVVQIRVTLKARGFLSINALSVSGGTWKWQILNHACSRISAAAAPR